MLIHATLEHPNQKWGGIGSAVALMARAAKALGVPCAVLSPAPPTVPPLEVAYDLRITNAQVRSPGDVYRAADRIAVGTQLSHAMAETIGDLGADHVQLLIHNEELLQLAAFGMQHRDVDVLYFAHGLSSQEHPGMAPLIHLQEELVALGAPVCAASYSQASLTRDALKRDVHTVRLPLALLVHDPPTSRPRAPRSIVAAGRCVPQKGFDLLVRSLGMIDPPPACTIVAGHGSESYRSQCISLASSVGSPVTWHPWTNQQSLRDRFSRAAAVVVPSRFEPLGLVAAEALSVGTPVIGFNVGGLGELLTSTDQLPIPFEDESAACIRLADALANIDSRPEVDRSLLLQWSPERLFSDLEECWRGTS